MSFFKQAAKVFLFRLLLLLKMKLAWFALFIGVMLLPISFYIAVVTGIHSEKIYWDLVLGFFFILQVGLSTYLASHLFAEEKQNKGLHALLSVGVGRGQWLSGNVFAIGTFFMLMNFLWLLFAHLTVYFNLGLWGKMITFQTQMLLSAEIFVILSMTLFFSLYLRPLFTWMLSLSLILLLHSAPQFEQALEQQVYQGQFQVKIFQGLSLVLKFFPPLDWFNLRDFVAYQALYSWSYVAWMIVLSIFWILFWQIAAFLRFRKMDL